MSHPSVAVIALRVFCLDEFAAVCGMCVNHSVSPVSELDSIGMQKINQKEDEEEEQQQVVICAERSLIQSKSS